VADDDEQVQTKPKGRKAAKTDKSVEGAGTATHSTEGPLAEGQESGLTLPDEPSAVSEPGPGEFETAVANLGAAVAAQDPTGTGGHDLSDGALDRAIETMEANVEAWVASSASLVADVRDLMLEPIKHRPKPWKLMNPGEQRDLAASCEQQAQELVRKVVETIAAGGRQGVRVFLKKVSLGEKIEISGEVRATADEEDDAVMLLHHARGKNVMLTVASKDDYQADHREAETDEEEPELGFEAGGEEVGDDILSGEDLIDEQAGSGEDGVAVKTPEAESFVTGELVQIADQGLCVVRVNLKTGMVEAQHPNRDEFDIDVRQATPDELAQERDRQADFPAEPPAGPEEQAQPAA